MNWGPGRALFIAVWLGCACGNAPAPELCPDAGIEDIHALCTLWASAATRLCSPDSGVCGTPSQFDCAGSCGWGEPFHCGGYPLYICGRAGIDDLNQVLDAGTCADLLPAAFGSGVCDGNALPK